MDIDAVNTLMADPVIQTGGGIAGSGGIFLWIFNGIKRRLDKNEEDIVIVQKNMSEIALDLEKHKTFSEGTYAKSTTIERVHERIDDVGKKTDEIYKLLVTLVGNK